MKASRLKYLVPVGTVLALITVALWREKPGGDSAPAPAKRPAAAQPVAVPAPGDSTAHEAKMLAAALQKNPAHVPILMRLARIAAESGRPADAIQYLRQAVQHEPANIEAHLDLGKLLFEKGDARGALEQNENILKIDPTHADALYNLGAIYGNIGNPEQAEHYWKLLLAAHPETESGRRAAQMLDLLKRDSAAAGK